VVQGAIREAREETGVLIDPADLAFSHVIHHRSPEGQARIGVRGVEFAACFDKLASSSIWSVIPAPHPG
jgi:8-oxo-dGTP pyrophosphatase MutT (NUDIX family)